MSIVFSIAEEFSPFPGGRKEKDGANSGEACRRMLLERYHKAREQDQDLFVVLDGAAGYSASFLDEVFGGSVRLVGEYKKDFFKRIKPKANSDQFSPYQKLAYKYMKESM